MTFDVVIPLSPGADYTELRYALRGIEKHLPRRGKVWLVGARPTWAQNVNFIPEADRSEKSAKEQNIFRKLMAAVQDKRVSDYFYYFNDDHFLLADFHDQVYHKGFLSSCIEKIAPSSLYRHTLANTLAYLGGGFNFDSHCPLLMNKWKFIASVGNAPWHQAYGFGIKSLYCNLNQLEGEYYPDTKFTLGLVYSQALVKHIADKLFFSTDERMVDSDMVQIWKNFYPFKSIYEQY